MENMNAIGYEMNARSRYEYQHPTKLNDVSGSYFVIPASIILSYEMNRKRATTFSFFSIRRGLDRKLFFSVNNIVRWMGGTPNRQPTGINAKVIQSINSMQEAGYLDIQDKIDNASLIQAVFDLDTLSRECRRGGFAVVYVDELDKIMSYQNPNTRDMMLNSDAILLVFAYLRMKIYRRKNRMLPEEVNLDNKNDRKYDIDERRFRAPEAYDCFYKEIAQDIGLSERTVSQAVRILNEFGLIYYEALPRTKYQNDNGETWRTEHTIFCNAYKREENYLLASGSEYYMTEIENKKKKIAYTRNRSRKGGGTE